MQNDKDVPVFPTPTIGMMGIVQDKSRITTLAFQEEGDRIYLLGDSKNDINSSEYLYAFHKVKQSPAPYFDLEEEFALQATLKNLIIEDLVVSAHDCADGGLFITLLEAAMPNNLGFEIDTDSDFRKDAYLFGEAQSRVVVSVNEAQEEQFIEVMTASNVPFNLLGEVKGKNMLIDGDDFGKVENAKAEFDSALENYLTK